jgi:hypothetical protein
MPESGRGESETAIADPVRRRPSSQPLALAAEPTSWPPPSCRRPNLPTPPRWFPPVSDRPTQPLWRCKRFPQPWRAARSLWFIRSETSSEIAEALEPLNHPLKCEANLLAVVSVYRPALPRLAGRDRRLVARRARVAPHRAAPRGGCDAAGRPDWIPNLRELGTAQERREPDRGDARDAPQHLGARPPCSGSRAGGLQYRLRRHGVLSSGEGARGRR